jgi:hypothetical protein
MVTINFRNVPFGGLNEGELFGLIKPGNPLLQEICLNISGIFLFIGFSSLIYFGMKTFW